MSANGPIASTSSPELNGVCSTWLYCCTLAAHICCTIIDGSVIHLQGPCHSLGSGPMGKGSNVEEAGMSILEIPPSLARGERIWSIVLYIRHLFSFFIKHFTWSAKSCAIMLECSSFLRCGRCFITKASARP